MPSWRLAERLRAARLLRRPRARVRAGEDHRTADAVVAGDRRDALDQLRRASSARR